MIVEVVAVGTELLLGQIVNGNAAVIGTALANAGLDAHFQQVVGDNQARLEAAIRLALSRSDAVLITGGIGPTQDDLTREGIAAATDRPLEFSEEYAETLRVRFAELGRDMPSSNLRQAEYPQGGELLSNPKGTAPGIALLHEGRLLFAMPGVTEEMEYLLHREVLPRLRKSAGSQGVLVSRVLRSWGRAEAQVAEILDDLYQGTNPSVAFLASAGEIKIRLSAKAPDEESARAMIAPIEEEVRRRLDPSVFGADDDRIEPVLLALLEERGWTIATAESATGGGVAVRLTSEPGSSRSYLGSVVAYSSAVKEALLEVPDVAAGVVTEEAAIAMAEGVKRLLGADVGIAVTGSAGPDPAEKPVGTMIVAVSTPERSAARVMRMPGDRERVRAYTATAALHLARLAVTGVWWRA